MCLYSDCAKIYGWDPLFICFERKPHDAANNMGIDEDHEGIEHDLHEGFVFFRERHVSDLLENFLQTLRFQQ